MKTPTQDRAGHYIQQVLDGITDDSLPNINMEVILLRCSHLADLDLAECLTNQQKQKVWAALLFAVDLVIRAHGGEGIAANALREALTNASLGRPGDHGLTSPTIPNTRLLDQEWVRACVIALIDEYPNLRQQTLTDASKLLDVSEDKVKKLRENFRGGGVGGDVLCNLVESAKRMIKEFGYESLSEILQEIP